MDSGFLTLLQTFNFPGLELEVNGVWFSVPPSKNTIVVNLGEQMTEMSNGRFKSTIHRVIDIGQDRYSIPFFYEPAYSTNINTKLPRGLLPPGSPLKDPKEDQVLPFGAFLLNKLPIYAEYAKICDNLPEWMRKKYVEDFKHVSNWASKSGVEIDVPSAAKRS